MIITLLQGNAIFPRLESIKELLVFRNFLVYKTLRAVVTLFFSNFFQLSFSDGKFIPSQLYLFIKGLIFVIPSECFPISS